MESYLCQENDGLQNKCDSGDSNPMQKESEALYTRARNGMPHPCTKPIDSGQAVAPHIVLSLKKKTMPDTGRHHRG